MTSKTKNWKRKIHDIIYEADTPSGKLFDIVLLILIVLSVIFVMLESITYFQGRFATFFNYAEWTITILFTIEYFLRVISINKARKYIFSFFGIIDLISTIPKYLSLFITGTHALIALRALRLLRVFRILKLTRFIGESNVLIKALKASRPKIAVFLFAVLILSVILGTIMYMVEGPANGFTSIPKGVYWCIVTLTTVGFGDIYPQSPLGQLIASAVMILGYGIIAVPTGIVGVEYAHHKKVSINTESCSNCHNETHQDLAKFCQECGYSLKD